MTPAGQSVPTVEDIVLEPIDSKGEIVPSGSARGHLNLVRLTRHHALFLTLLVLPTLLASIYFFAIAADRYVSEARFVVRSTASPAAGNFAAMIESEGLSRANDETYAVNEYLDSRDIVDLLARNDGLKEVLARPEADFIGRFPNFYMPDNAEYLYRRYRYMVDARIDPATGISRVEVEAFRAGDAHKIGAAILKYAEALINRLNERAYQDAERYAESIVDRERAHISEIGKKLSVFRDASGTVDPGKEAVAQFELIGKMSTSLAMLVAEEQQQSVLAPANPGLPALREQIRSYRDEIEKQKRSIVGSNNSLAAKLTGFEEIELERQLAARALGLAMINLEKARDDARRQHLYLQTIVEPNIPDQPAPWRRALGFAVVFFLSLAVFGIVRALAFIASEHTA